MPQNPFNEKSTLVQVMAWCRQATSHYLIQCWPRFMSPYSVTRPQWVNDYIKWYPKGTIPYTCGAACPQETVLYTCRRGYPRVIIPHRCSQRRPQATALLTLSKGCPEGTDLFACIQECLKETALSRCSALCPHRTVPYTRSAECPQGTVLYTRSQGCTQVTALYACIKGCPQTCRQSQVRNGSGVEWAECSLIIGTGCWVQVLSLILDSSVGLSAGIQSAGDSVPKTLVQILHSAEKDFLSPFDLKIVCLCQSIEINNNKHVSKDVLREQCWIYVV